MMRVGYLPGVWDLFHVGHLRVMRAARERCDHLVVGVCSDDCVERSKGSVPVVNQWQRLEVVRWIKVVDDALIYHDVDQSGVLENVHPAGFFCGPEYGRTAEQQATTEACLVRGTMVFELPRTRHISTTTLREKARGAS